MPQAQEIVPTIGTNIAALRANAAEFPPGYVDYVLTHGKINGDMVLLDAEDQNEFRQKFPLRGMPGVFGVTALKKSAPYQPAGYSEFILSRGKVKGDLVALNNVALRELEEKYPPKNRAIVLNIAELKANADKQMPGFVEFALSRGKIEGDLVIIDASLRKEIPRPRLKRILLTTLKDEAQYQPDGYYEYVLSQGKISDDWVLLSHEASRKISEKFPFFRISLQELMDTAPRRPDGFVDYLFAHGKRIDHTIILTQEAARAFHMKFPVKLRPSPPEPTTAEMAANFAGAMAAWAKAGFATVARKIYDQRVATCAACEHWETKARGGLGKCKICGCTKLKFWLANSKCPDKPPRW